MSADKSASFTQSGGDQSHHKDLLGNIHFPSNRIVRGLPTSLEDFVTEVLVQVSFA